MLVGVQIFNALLIFAAGILLATRIYPRLFESADATGHDYAKDLQAISRQLSEKQIKDADTDYLKQQTVRAISLMADSLVDSKVAAGDTRSRTRVGLILLAVGTFIQSLLLVFAV